MVPTVKSNTVLYYQPSIIKHMKHSNHHSLVFILGVTLSYTAIGKVWAQQDKNGQSLSTEVAHHYLKSFPVTIHPSTTTTLNLKRAAAKTQFLKIDQVKLSESTQRKIILRTLYPGITVHPITAKDDLLNSHSWTDLKLFNGTSDCPTHHLLSRINRTTTVLGECALATLLATPTSDVTLLRSRQKTIQLLLEQPDCHYALKKELENYAKIEPHLLCFWTPTDPLYTREYQAYMQNRFFTKDARSNKMPSKLKRKIFFRNWIDIYGEFLALPILGGIVCSANYFSTALTNSQDYMKPDLKSSFTTFPSLYIPLYSIFETSKNYVKAGSNRSLRPFLGIIITHGLAIWRGYCGIQKYREYNMIFRKLANRMHDVQLFMQTLQRINDIVTQNEILTTIYTPSLKETKALLDRRKEKTEIGLMVRNFLEMKLDNWSYFRQNGGQLLATYKLFEEYKDCLRPAMYELGQLDSLMGIATLMQEAKANYPTHCCYTFTKFLDRTQQKTPSIQFNAMWNPLLDPATVVTNEVEMDTHKTRNMILCGPNAGGKSSFLSGVAIGLLLSQTFGITPAQYAVITPFNKIHTHIEKKNDIIHGASLLMAELDRIYKHMDMLESTSTDEFVFAIMDEPVTGTNPMDASAITYDCFAHIAEYTNALHIMASHYPVVMDLEEDIKGQSIQNFKVDVIEKADKALQYTYKIVPGCATQTTALKLAHQGYKRTGLKHAANIVKHPEKIYKRLKEAKKKTN